MTIKDLSFPLHYLSEIRKYLEYEAPSNIDSIIIEANKFLGENNNKLSKELLEQGYYKNLDINVKKWLSIYFYIIYHFNCDKDSENFLGFMEIANIIGISKAELTKSLADYTFCHSYICPNCKTENDVNFIGLRPAKVDGIQLCVRCDHKISEKRILSECTCTSCKKLIKNVDDYFFNFSKNVDTYYSSKSNDLSEHINDKNISNEKLRFYANKHSSDLTKNEREIISFKPKHVNEINELVSNRKEFNKTLAGLENKKVVVDKFRMRDLSSIKIEILSTFFQIKYHSQRGSSIANGQYLNIDNAKVDSILLNENIFFYPKEGDLLSNERDYSNLSISLPSNNASNIQFIEKEQIFNPYYFSKETIDFLPSISREHTKPLFNSKVENNQYFTLKAKYSDNIIMVNVRLADLIELKCLKSHFSPEDFEYLKYCIVDFVIYDEKGWPQKVVELQRGEHHNDNQWIQKDYLKKQAISKIGLLFEEYY